MNTNINKEYMTSILLNAFEVKATASDNIFIYCLNNVSLELNDSYSYSLWSKDRFLMDRFSLYTLILTGNNGRDPTENDFKEYQELQKKIAKYPTLNQLFGAMLIFLGIIIEIPIVIPRIVINIFGSFDLGFNPVFKTGVLLFNYGKIASIMKYVEKNVKLINSMNMASRDKTGKFATVRMTRKVDEKNVLLTGLSKH